jgi:urease accessory protein
VLEQSGVSVELRPGEPAPALRPIASAAGEAIVTPRLQRSCGAGRISFKLLDRPNGARTVLDDLEQSGCIRLRMPRAEPRVAPSAVLINTAGGLADGDVIRLAAAWAPDTLAAITSQAAERIYRAREDQLDIQPASIETTLCVGAGATGVWLPQETILFDGGRYRRRIAVDVALGGRLLACESLIFGRRAMGERVTSGFVHDGWRVRHAGRLVLADALRLDGDFETLLDRPGVGRGARALATVLLVGEGAEACLEPARGTIAAIGATAGVSLVGPVLVVRLLAADGADLRRDLTRILDGLLQTMACTFPQGHAGSDLALPRSWHF